MKLSILIIFVTSCVLHGHWKKPDIPDHDLPESGPIIFIEEINIIPKFKDKNGKIHYYTNSLHDYSNIIRIVFVQSGITKINNSDHYQLDLIIINDSSKERPIPLFNNYVITCSYLDLKDISIFANNNFLKEADISANEKFIKPRDHLKKSFYIPVKHLKKGINCINIKDNDYNVKSNPIMIQIK